MQTFDLGKGSFTDYDPEWIETAAAAALHAQLTDELAWTQRPIYAFGKPLMQPRLIAWEAMFPIGIQAKRCCSTDTSLFGSMDDATVGTHGNTV